MKREDHNEIIVTVIEILMWKSRWKTEKTEAKKGIEDKNAAQLNIQGDSSRTPS